MPFICGFDLYRSFDTAGQTRCRICKAARSLDDCTGSTTCGPDEVYHRRSMADGFSSINDIPNEPYIYDEMFLLKILS